jgi:uncharacterized membrane protein YqiK
MKLMEILGITCLAVTFLLLGGIGALSIIVRFYRKVDQGRALIVNVWRGEPVVSFTGSIVYPIVNRAEVMDISVKSMVIARSGQDGLICQDNIRADIKVAFFVRVNKTKEDVLKVAQAIGCERASKQETLEELFAAKFSEALKTVGKQLDFEDLYTRREEFKDRIIEVIGRDLNGYVLEDVAIDYLEQTRIEELDKDNILDARGIRKITEITAQQHMLTNELRQNEKKTLTHQNFIAHEAILEIQRQQADAEARQQREIATVRAREAAETAKVESEERQRSELARLRAEEEVEVQAVAKARQVETALQDKARVLAVKQEQVDRDRDLEVIARKREVERQEIDKEMELEVKRKEIADVVRGRIVVDKQVAEEEERIKDLRATAEANRRKDVTVIDAQASAEEAMVQAIKEAEAQEKVAEHAARKRLIAASAEFDSAEKVAKAKIRIAEGVQAEQAASGLAQVKVKEANAMAIEKEGLAMARVELERLQAVAKGEEEQGLARVRVLDQQGGVEAQVVQKKMEAEAAGKLAGAEAIARHGAAEAEATRLKLIAQAEGQTAEAKAVQALGEAEAAAHLQMRRAEASGLQAKLEAMQKMEGAARDHEEFRLRLQHDEKVRLATLEAQQQLAEAQSRVLAEAFGKADIKIVGGDGQFLDRFVQAASVGNMVDGFLSNSATAQGLLAPYLSGQRSVGDALKDVVDAVRAPTNGNGHAVQASAVLEQLVDTADGADRAKLEDLLLKARELESK